MEKDYHINRTADPENYVVIRKKHPAFMAYMSNKDGTMRITKINLMENCKISILAKTLAEMEIYLKDEIGKNVTESST